MQAKFSIWPRAGLQLIVAAGALLTLSACADTSVPTSSAMRLGAATFAPQGYIRFCERRPDQCGLPSPIADADRVKLERVLNQQQWANVFNLQPTSVSSTAAKASEVVDPKAIQTIAVDMDQPFAELDLSPPTMPITLEAPRISVAQADVPARHQGKDALHLTPMVWAAMNGINQSINARIRPMTDEQAFGIPDYWTLPLSDGPRPVGNCKHYALEKRKALVEAGFSADALSIAIVKTGWGEVHAVLVVSTDQGDYVLDNLSTWIKGWQDARYTWLERQTPGQPLRWATLAEAQTYRTT